MSVSRRSERLRVKRYRLAEAENDVESAQQLEATRETEAKHESEQAKKSSARFSLTEYDDGVAFLPQRLSIGEVCSACSAKMWKNETHSGSATSGVLKFSTCCNQGKVVLPPVSDAPAILQNLMLDTTPEAKQFRDNIRAYNSSLAFTSLGAKTPAVIGHGPPVFQIQGTVYHRRRVDTKTCKSIASFFSKRGHDSEQNSVTLTTTVPVAPSCPVPIEAEVVMINHDVTTTPPSKRFV